MRSISKIVVFCIFCYLFTCFLSLSSSLCSIVSKIGILLLTCAFSWHTLSYLWASHLSARRNRISPHNKCLFITGCDTGFGHLTSLALCDAGFTVFAGCLNDKSPESVQLLEKCSHPSKMHILKVDVTKVNDIINARHIIEKHCEETGETFHGLVNNAGISAVGAIEWGQIDDLQRIFDVNLYGTIEVTRQFIPLLRKSHDSRIVSMTSYITSAASPFMFSYGVSKVAVKAFFNNLREEMKLESDEVANIKTITIEPTIFKTQMLGPEGMVRSIDNMWASSRSNVQEAYTDTFFDAVIAFFQIWKMFEFLDFIALRRDISLVSDSILRALTTESPETNHRVIGLMGRASLSTVIYFMPQECVEKFYEISALVLIAWAVHLKWLKRNYENITGKRFPWGRSDKRAFIPLP